MTDFTIVACSRSREALENWINRIREEAEKRGIEYGGPIKPPQETINNKSFSKRIFELPSGERIRDIVSMEPPDEVFVQMGAKDTSFSISEIVPESELSADEQTDVIEDNDLSIEKNEINEEVNGNEPSETSETQLLDQGSEGVKEQQSKARNQVSNKSAAEIDDLRERAENAAVEDIPESATTTRQTTREYTRSSAIREYVKARADGYCEGCGSPAPFTSKTGEPYLHAHHLHELSDGGSDTPDTVIALCPNCHYRVHHGEDGDDYNQKLLEIVQEIERGKND